MDAAIIEASARFERPMRELADELACRYSQTRIYANNLPVGSATAFQGHVLCVECIWPGRVAADPDCVALEIVLCHLTTSPRINADVCWSDGTVEKEFVTECSSSEEWPEATPAVLDRLSDRMPELIEAFRQAVERGMPAG